MKKNSQSRRAKNTPERREERFSAFPFPLPCLKIPYAFPGASSFSSQPLYLSGHHASPGLTSLRALYFSGTGRRKKTVLLLKTLQ